jgi:hypothetical protein
MSSLLSPPSNRCLPTSGIARRRPSWESQALPLIVSRGTRARSSDRRRPSSRRTSGRCACIFRWKAGCELFNLGIDSKLRGCDLVALRVQDVCHGDQVATRAIVMQHKTAGPGAVRDHGRYPRRLASVDQAGWAEAGGLLVPEPAPRVPHLGTQQTPGSLGIGSTNWGWTAPSTARTRCDGPRRR